MIRSKEIRFFTLTALLLIGLMAVLIILLPSYALATALIFSLLLIGYFLGFTAWRYRRISQMADMVHRILHEDYRMPFTDYEEGELSYLQSVLTKVTLKLTEQSELLLKDKHFLADTLSDISHQLKTPLTSMMVMTDLLSDEQLPPAKRREFTGQIAKQLKRIEWLVATLLKISKLDAGAVSLKQENIQVDNLVRSAVSPLLIPLELKRQQLIIDGQDCRFRGDFSWSNEALTNIIKNCLEHTPPEGVIRIEYGQNRIYTFIRISDTGPGIDPADLPHIFKRFYKGKNSAPDSVGIGLSLANQIISRQHGIIEVTSERNIGTVFLIKLYQTVV